MWYVVHELEKSGLCFIVRLGVIFPLCVVSSFADSGSPAFFEVTDLMYLGVVMAGGRQLLHARSKFQLQIEGLDVKIVATLKNFKASMKGSSSRWRPASTYTLGVFLYQRQWLAGWLLRSLMMKMTRRTLQGCGCNFLFCSEMSL